MSTTNLELVSLGLLIVAVNVVIADVAPRIAGWFRRHAHHDHAPDSLRHVH